MPKSIWEKIILVHQITDLTPAMANMKTKNIIIKAEMDMAYSNLQKLEGRFVNDVDALYVSQSPFLTILKELKSEKYFDWVFSGLKDARISKRIFIGSATISIFDNTYLFIVAVPIQTKVSVPKKLIAGIKRRYTLNKHQFRILLSKLRENLSELGLFTILGNNENETDARDHPSALQIEYKDFSPAFRIYKEKNAFKLFKECVKHTADSFLILQQGSLSLWDYLFRKFTISKFVNYTQTPLIVMSS